VETWKVILIIAIVFAVVWSNIALLKYSAKFDIKKFNQDPTEKAKEARKKQEEKTKKPHK
jgi:hypothetical protein